MKGGDGYEFSAPSAPSAPSASRRVTPRRVHPRQGTRGGMVNENTFRIARTLYASAFHDSTFHDRRDVEGLSTAVTIVTSPRVSTSSSGVNSQAEPRRPRVSLGSGSREREGEATCVDERGASRACACASCRCTIQRDDTGEGTGRLQPLAAIAAPMQEAPPGRRTRGCSCRRVAGRHGIVGRSRGSSPSSRAYQASRCVRRSGRCGRRRTTRIPRGSGGRRG